MNRMYGFEGEVKAKYLIRLLSRNLLSLTLQKYSDTVYELFATIFCLLPLAHLINKKVISFPFILSCTY